MAVFYRHLLSRLGLVLACLLLATATMTPQVGREVPAAAAMYEASAAYCIASRSTSAHSSAAHPSAALSSAAVSSTEQPSARVLRPALPDLPALARPHAIRAAGSVSAQDHRALYLTLCSFLI